MQISSIYLNKNSCVNYNCKNNNNSSQYPAQNIAFGQLYGQKSLTSLLCKYIPSLQTKKQYQTAIKEQYLNAIEHCKNDAEQIFSRSIVFGSEEYQNLSNKELTTLRKYIDIFYKTDILYNYEEKFKCANFIKSFGKLFSERLHEKYPEGFIFVSVGRSPAFLAKYLEFQGEEVKYCPISGLHCNYLQHFPVSFIQEYKNYLYNIGLTKELAENTQKPIIITDYVEHGHTLYYFRRLLTLPQIGIKEGEMVKYSPITACNYFEEGNWIFKSKPVIYDKFGRYDYREFMNNEKTKQFTSIPSLGVKSLKPGSRGYEILQKYYQDGNKFEEDFDTKMMNFIIADSIYNR